MRISEDYIKTKKKIELKKDLKRSKWPLVIFSV